MYLHHHHIIITSTSYYQHHYTVDGCEILHQLVYGQNPLRILFFAARFLVTIHACQLVQDFFHPLYHHIFHAGGQTTAPSTPPWGHHLSSGVLGPGNQVLLSTVSNGINNSHILIVFLCFLPPIYGKSMDCLLYMLAYYVSSNFG